MSCPHGMFILTLGCLLILGSSIEGNSQSRLNNRQPGLSIVSDAQTPRGDSHKYLLGPDSASLMVIHCKLVDVKDNPIINAHALLLATGGVQAHALTDFDGLCDFIVPYCKGQYVIKFSYLGNSLVLENVATQSSTVNVTARMAIELRFRRLGCVGTPPLNPPGTRTIHGDMIPVGW